MKLLKDQKIALLLGGFSSEREVSLISGNYIYNALSSLGYNITKIDPQEYDISKLKIDGFERVFNILHGTYGEDGSIQGFLDVLGIPYTGCKTLQAAISMDKIRTKMLWKANGLPIADFVYLTKYDKDKLDINFIESTIEKLSLPLFVKPNLEGSSVGVYKVKSKEELLIAINNVFDISSEVIIESFIDGNEYSISILGKDVLDAVQIIPEGEFYDYNAKYISNNTRYICPAPLSDENNAKIIELARKATEVLGLDSWCRLDFMDNSRGELILLEINTCPGMTDHSLFPMSANNKGIDFPRLCERILELSLDK